MTDKKTFVLSHQQARNMAKLAIDEAPNGYYVVIHQPKRTDDQNGRFHSNCGEFAKSSLEWAGKRRTSQQWKVLFVSGHAVATNEKAEMVPGLESEFVNIRESTALMSVKRGSSLIEYQTAFAAENGVILKPTWHEVQMYR